MSCNHTPRFLDVTLLAHCLFANVCVRVSVSKTGKKLIECVQNRKKLDRKQKRKKKSSSTGIKLRDFFFSACVKINTLVFTRYRVQP